MLNKTSQGKARTAKLMDRSDQYLAEHIRRAEVKGGLETQGGVVILPPCQLMRHQPPLSTNTTSAPASLASSLQKTMCAALPPAISASEFVLSVLTGGAAANAAPPGGANLRLGPSPELHRLGPLHELEEDTAAAPLDDAGHGMEPTNDPDESMELPAPQGQAQDEGMNLGVHEEKLLEKELKVMQTVFKKDPRA